MPHLCPVTIAILLSLVASTHSSQLDSSTTRPDITGETVQHLRSLLKAKKMQLKQSTTAYESVLAMLKKALNNEHVPCYLEPCGSSLVQLEYIEKFKRERYLAMLSNQADVDYLGWKLAVQMLKGAQEGGGLKQEQLDELKNNVTKARKKVTDRRRSQEGLNMVLPEDRVGIKTMAAVGWLGPEFDEADNADYGHYRQPHLEPELFAEKSVTRLWLLLVVAIIVVLLALALIILISVDTVKKKTHKKKRSSLQSEG